MKEYKDKETGLTFIAKINEASVSLRIPSEKDGWELLAFKPLEVKKIHLCLNSRDVFLQLQKEVVDNYRPGREIPYFPFRVKLKDVENPRPMWAKVHLDGVEKEEYIIVSRNPDTPRIQTTSLPLAHLDTGEPPEITRLTTNLIHITDAVTAGGSPQWFADCLVERAFITREAASGIRDTTGISPAVQASRLMDSVFTKINGSDNKRHWFDEFVDIFSHDRAYAELVETLTKEA